MGIKRSTVWAALAVGTLAGMIGACPLGGMSSPGNQPARHKIVYHVAGEGTADITYTLEANIAQAGSAKLPWTFKTEKSTAIGRVLSAQLKSDAAGSITCSVIVDDKVTVTNTSYGLYAVVSCASDQ